MDSCSLFEVTVYVGLGCIAYLFLSQREFDGQNAGKLAQLGNVDPAIHHAKAVRAKTLEMPDLVGYWEAVGHSSGGSLGHSATQTVELPQLARAFVLRPASLEEFGEFNSKD
jgi:hypothetical protein